MVVLVLVLIGTNLATLGTLLYFLYGPLKVPMPDEAAAAALNRATPPRPGRGTRRLITIEILNPIELAGTRGRLAGVAGSLAPGLTRRIVYEQAVRNVRRQLAAERVVADVRVHTLRPPAPDPAAGMLPAPRPPDGRSDFEPQPGTGYDEPLPFLDDERPTGGQDPV